MNIASVNLNLLVVLDALLDERHVSRAARRLGLSQPAVSNALAQLRAIYDDPLLVRGHGEMLPTERALALREPLRAGLSSLTTALGAPSFDPTTSQHTFVIAATDFVEFVLLPRLLARLASVAPGVRLRLLAWSYHRVPPSLASGDADVMIGFYPEVPAGHREERLFPDEFVCVVRRDHPRVGKRLTLPTYLRLLHVLVTSEAAGSGVVDEVLARRGLGRTIGLRTSHFLMVPNIIAATDYVAALSRRVAEAFAAPLGLRVLPPPIEIPRGTVGQVWHERTHASPAHAWLRSQIAAVAREV